MQLLSDVLSFNARHIWSTLKHTQPIVIPLAFDTFRGFKLFVVVIVCSEEGANAWKLNSAAVKFHRIISAVFMSNIQFFFYLICYILNIQMSIWVLFSLCIISSIQIPVFRICLDRMSAQKTIFYSINGSMADLFICLESAALFILS